MNLFMRSVSILASAAFLSLAPVSFALASTQDAANDNTAGVTLTVDPNLPIPNENCDAYFSCKQNSSTSSRCKLPNGLSKCEKKGKDGSDPQPTNSGQGTGGNPDQNQNSNEEQPQQASSGSSSANCNDTSSDPENTQAKNKGTLKNKGADVGVADKPGVGKKSACQQINGSFDQRARQAYQQGEVGKKGLSGTNFPALEKDLQEYAKNREACLTNQAGAANQCLEGLSPNTDQAAAGVNNVLGQVGQNASDTCGKFSKAMDLAKAGLAAFNGQCGAAKGGCSSSCSKATSGLAALKKKAQAAMSSANCSQAVTPEQQAACPALLEAYKSALQEGIQAAEQEMDSKDPEAVAGKQSLCDKKYTANIGSALQGIMSMLAGMKQGSKCEEETDGTAEQLGTLADKCMQPENASLPECICKANPRTVGCSAAYQSMSANGKNELGGGINDKANVDPSGNSGTLDNNGLGGMEQAARSPSGDGGAGAPMGGGGAGIGSSTVGNGNGAGGGEGAGGKGLNTNILGGAGGGGAGGGAWGAGGAGDKYRQYLPGGAKDPAKALAGQQSWKNEVTGQGGKSNWEKVKDRYRDNKSTLLNQN
ncbi:hypothetical protein AZI86_05890 [Bdellovibrio bacteriovorus]|uniref:Uncharacterized protein n=1 Tax=Bdellovibrio bacteriovorus TaxID=959 RepID=A0A150WQU6_BDEBC|nr:hypothetical protein [Bdellovibrio bacteriovorus]KYG66575.1 hypothetical protein AZI86_05890 [Bdellovibrio bacteriovorus]